MLLTNMVLYKFNVCIAIASLQSGNKQNKTKRGGWFMKLIKAFIPAFG